MVLLFVAGLILGGLAVMFDLQNLEQITVVFFQWQFTGSLAVVLALTFLAGFTAAALMSVPELISNYFAFRRLKKENQKLAEDLRRQKEKTVFAAKTIPTAEELDRLDKGVIAEYGSLGAKA